MSKYENELKLVAIPTTTAQWAGMAPAVAGGWIMNCEVGEMAMDRLLSTDEKLACVRDGQSYGGREIESAKVMVALNEAIGRTSRRRWKRDAITHDLTVLRGWIERVKLIA